MTYDPLDPDADGTVDSDIDSPNATHTDITASNSITLNGTMRTSWPSSSGSTTSIGAVPSGNTISDIQNAYNDSNVVQLEPGVTYTGSQTLNLDPDVHSDQETVYIFGNGAMIDSSADIAVDIPGQTVQNYAPCVWLFDMDVSGPGIGTAGSCAYRFTDGFGHCVIRCAAGDAETALLFRNVNNWSEKNSVRNFRFSDCQNGVELRGGSDTGGSGTKSFRSFELRGMWGSPGPGGSGFNVMPGASPYNGRVDHIDCFVNDDNESSIRVAGSWQGVLATNIVAEGRLDGTNPSGNCAIFFDNTNIGTMNDFKILGVHGQGNADATRGTDSGNWIIG